MSTHFDLSCAKCLTDAGLKVLYMYRGLPCVLCHYNNIVVCLWFVFYCEVASPVVCNMIDCMLCCR